MFKMMDLPSFSFIAVFLILATSGFGTNIESRAQEIDENLRRLAKANNDLAINIYRQLSTGSNENIFFSPLSLSTAFGLLYYGTRGSTAEELRQALGYERAGLVDVPQTFRKYLTETLPSQDTTAYTLKSANAVLLDDDLDLVPTYKSDVQHYYQASVEDVDFTTQGPQVVRQINDWVKEETNGKIDKLLDNLDPSTLMVLLNAVYFKGTWKTEFDPSETRQWGFFNYGLMSGKTNTSTMSMTKKFPYVQRPGTKVLELPYKGDNISMVILLPNEMDGLGEQERSLTPTTFQELRSRLVERYVSVALPKFKMEFSRELTGQFRSLGARKVFAPGADFSGIAGGSGRNITVGQVAHKAVIEVNESGSEAAAVTGRIPVRPLPNFAADHPFFFAIIDRRNDLILFLGRVTNL